MDKPKFNLMDGFIALLIILVVAAGIFFLKGKNTEFSSDASNKTAVFSIQFTKVEKVFCSTLEKALAEGALVSVGTKERFDARLEGLDIKPSIKITSNLQNGKAVVAEDPMYFDITVSLSAPCTETPDAILASGTALKVGEQTSMHGKGFAGNGFVIGLELLEN